MIALAWGTGHTVLVALAWMVLALSIAAGMTAAGIGLAALWVWKWLRRRTATGPRRGLSARLSHELRSRDPRVPETADRRSGPPTRKEAT